MAVTPTDVATTLGRPAPAAGSADALQWSMWIADALVLIEARLGDPADLDQDLLDYVVREAVAARVRNPDPASTATTVSVDDGSVTKRYERSTGQITILPEWWDLLRPASDSGAFSTRPSFEADTPSDSLGWT